VSMSDIFQRILCAVDGSENSIRAAHHAGVLAKQSGGVVVLFSCYHIPHEMLNLEVQMGAGTPFIERVRKRFSDRHQRTLNDISKRLEADGVTAETVLQEGAPGPSIVDGVEALKCDTVVVGSRGMGDFKRLLLGSVSDYAVHHCKVPCLVVP
jgi:nucleotide-binding universal stress UspA family protein